MSDKTPAVDPAAAAAEIAEAYKSDDPLVDLGRVVIGGQTFPDAAVQIPLSSFNRHGLIAGATGTGKTVTLQVLAERLSAAGVPSVVADMKGDLSGLAHAGGADGPAPGRMTELGLPYTPAAAPVEFLSLGGIGPGVPVRAAVSDFGPQLLAKILGSNETQEQSLGLLFHYADGKGLPLVDLEDMRAMLMFLDSDAGRDELKGIGGVSPQTVGVLLRQITTLGDAGGKEFFGEPQFKISDLIRTAPDGRGVVSSIELPAIQDKPALFSTALMWLVAELFEELPEVGDLDKPKLVFFFDEAHLLFSDASKAFLDQITQTVRLIRSKGVGIFFVTQNPTDVPAEVLGQLGSRVQHALRAFTPDDAKALKATVSTYPKTEHYEMGELLTQLGIGEAVVTVLSKKGIPTPVAHTRLVAPASRMGVADDIAAAAKASPLFATYGTTANPESASELLAARLNQAAAPAGGEAAPAPAGGESQLPKVKGRAKKQDGTLESVGDMLQSSTGKTVQREIVRGVFGLLKKQLR